MSRLTRTLRGSAAAHGGEAQPHRRASMNREEAAPPWVEAQPRRCKSKLISVSRRLTAMCGGRAAKASSYFTGQITILFCRPYATLRKSRPLIPAMNRWAIFVASLRDAFFFRMLATNRVLLTYGRATAPRVLANRNATATESIDAYPRRSYAAAFANATAESASMGRGDFVSWVAVGSRACDRPDGIWRDLVCD